jgi:hypothetical protein
MVLLQKLALFQFNIDLNRRKMIRKFKLVNKVQLGIKRKNKRRFL